MRVISGKFKCKKLYAPADNRVRPTTDRIKETLFNILASKGFKDDITVLDLFGGSGALGIEALSRGAAKVVFIDRDPESVRLIKQNLAHVGALSGEYEIYNKDFAFALKKLQGRKFDVVFADPPYAGGYEKQVTALVDLYGILKSDGVLVIEHSSDVAVDSGSFTNDERICGNTKLSFLSYNKEDAHNE